MQLNSEVLPAPFGPTSPKIWQGSTAKLTACSILTPPNCRLTPCRVSPPAIDRPSCLRHGAPVRGPRPVRATRDPLEYCQQSWRELRRRPTVSGRPSEATSTTRTDTHDREEPAGASRQVRRHGAAAAQLPGGRLHL